MPAEYRFRSTPAYASPDAPPTVDFRAGVIRGVSMAQAVEALGHGMDLDATSLQQVCDAVNSTGDTGIKSRLGHPGACENATGKMLGKVKNARIAGDKAVCDFHLSQSAKTMPGAGDAYTYVLKRAQEDPSSFGMSIAFLGNPVWKLKDGSEAPSRDDDGPVKRPANAVGPRPVARIAKLSAVDVVEDPAANRSGMFSAAFSGTSSALADEAFTSIDAFLAENGIEAERLPAFVSRYFAARKIQFATNPPASPAPKKGNAMTPEQLKALKAKHPDHAGLIVDMFADGKTEAEMLSAIEKATERAALSNLLTKVNELTAKAEKERNDNKASLQAANDQIEKLKTDLAAANKIAELGKKAPADVGGLESDAAPAGSEAELSKKWDTDPALRAKFFDDKDAYLAMASLSFQSVTGAEGSAVSLAPKAKPVGWQPIVAANAGPQTNIEKEG